MVTHIGSVLPAIKISNFERSKIADVCYLHFLPLPSDIVGKGIMFSGCLSGHLFIYSFGQILLRCLMNALNNYDETGNEYSLAVMMT